MRETWKYKLCERRGQKISRGGMIAENVEGGVDSTHPPGLFRVKKDLNSSEIDINHNSY